MNEYLKIIGILHLIQEVSIEYSYRDYSCYFTISLILCPNNYLIPRNIPMEN